MSYTRDPTEQGRYVESTIVTVSCDEGYRSSGNITCQNDGNWSFSSLPNCASKPALATRYNTIYMYYKPLFTPAVILDVLLATIHLL